MWVVTIRTIDTRLFFAFTGIYEDKAEAERAAKSTHCLVGYTAVVEELSQRDKEAVYAGRRAVAESLASAAAAEISYDGVDESPSRRISH